MRRPIVAPDLGSATPVLSVWYVRPGERVYAGDRVVELLLAGATFDVPSPCAGTVVEQHARPGDPTPPGQVLGDVEEEAES
jgi:pyruvate dehydrogenase E2 component (dihydrolipoamide acetyltransferase)